MGRQHDLRARPARDEKADPTKLEGYTELGRPLTIQELIERHIVTAQAMLEAEGAPFDDDDQDFDLVDGVEEGFGPGYELREMVEENPVMPEPAEAPAADAAASPPAVQQPEQAPKA